VSTESNPAAECFSVTAAKSTTSTQQTITESGPASIVIGAQGSVSDTVTVLGNSTGGPPTGSVSFYICYFPSGGYNLCPSSWGKALGPKTLHSTGSDTSGTTSAAYTMLNKVGTYCFSAVYTPDSTSNYKGSSDNMWGTVDDNECVTVNPAVPGFTTSIDQPKDPSVGHSWRDWATVTGNPTGGAPTGWVTFTWCRATWPTFTCTGTKGGGWAGTVNAPKPSGDASIFGPSATVTPTHVGVYCFNARFDATKGTPMREWFSLNPGSALSRAPLAREALDFAIARGAK